ncbi:MAG: carbohydrate kinase [Pseudooceanicola sp.]|nr:carbohydrate kinase [Pseudooceanicola sp.]
MILCCGEALIDMISAPTADGGKGYVPHVGGAVFNTAIALGRQGVATGMLTGLSGDIFGQQLDDALTASGVDTRHVVRSARPTTLAFVTLSSGQASYLFYDENSASRSLTPGDIPPLAASVDALYFGGISLACEPGAETYADLLRRHGPTRAVMLDPNIRPDFVQDEPRYRARLARMIKQSDVLKLSDEDLDWLSPGSETDEVKARAMLTKGPAAVIITRGGDGASGYLADDATIDVPSEKVDIVDTVGAGDTFNAGVLTSFAHDGLLTKSAIRGLNRQQLATAMAYGARVAAITVSRTGANPPWPDEM